MIPLRLIKGSKPMVVGDEVIEFWKHRKNPRVRWTDESAEEFICKYLRRCEERGESAFVKNYLDRQPLDFCLMYRRAYGVVG